MIRFILGGTAVGGSAFNRRSITQGFQDRHIASDKNKATRNHELWSLSGINVNSRINKIDLPNTTEQHPTRSIHSGRRSNSYSVQIAREMGKIVQRGKTAGWSQTQYREATRKAFAEVRQELRSGSVSLNKNHRPWARKW